MDIDLEWARCAHLLKKTLKRDGDIFTLADVRAEVEAGKALFWPGKNSAGITEINRDLHVWLAAGDLPELIEMEAAASRWARAHGFDRMTFESRKGWERLMPGYRPLRLMVKDL